MADPDAAVRIDEFIRARGPDYERLVRARRERANKLRRDARKRLTPAQRADVRARDRVRKVEERKYQTPELREREKVRERARPRKLRPFMAIDGEGGGTDRLGRQNYLLMVASEAVGEARILKHKGRHLRTDECFDFLLSLPARPILVSFFFGYDVTQMLRGIPSRVLRRILSPPKGKNGPSYTFWGDRAVIYQQGQYLSVARIDRSGPKPTVIKGSCRTVYDTAGFFQCAFVKAIGDWEIGSEEERGVIAENKALRDQFSGLTKDIIEYCELECRCLAQLMSEFREVCIAADIVPRRWSGAGWLAAALLGKHGIPKRPLSATEATARAELRPSKNPRPPAPRRPERRREFELAARSGYYGGRFEVSRIGLITGTNGPVYEYDQRSAFPAGMPRLPCPLHTRWEHRPRARHLPDDGICLAKLSFSHPDGPWCGFPFRHNRRLFSPLQGTGWYWSPETRAILRHLRADILLRDLWVARCDCDCQPFEWVRAVYDERRRLGSSTRGYPLKLALNSLYGKTAQRVGVAPYHDAVSAGLITSMTRARLIEALGPVSGAVFMLAADAVFSTEPLALDIGEGLGQWEEQTWPDLFVVQPGVYWSPTDMRRPVKSRGAPRSAIGDAAPQFQETFAEWFELMRDPAARELLLKERHIPSVSIAMRAFIGHRLAIARGKSWTAGQWKEETRHVSFEWSTKRDPMRIALGDRSLSTFPPALSILAESQSYKGPDFERSEGPGNVALTVEGDDNALLEGMPDHVRLVPHE